MDKLGDVLPELADKKNHVIDALRYAIEPLRFALAGQGFLDIARQDVAAVKTQAPAISEARAAPGSLEFMKAMGPR